MKKFLMAGALSTVAAFPVHAESATLEQVLQELRALSDRVGRLEADNGQLRSENVELRARNDRLEATAEYLKDNASATRRQLAEEGPRLVEAERIAKAAEWASRVGWKADLRYRHETVDPEAIAADQTRHRLRARLGLSAKINETLSGTIQLATGGGNDDPRSTNQTLGDGWDRKDIALDQAYVEWRPVAGFSALAGKMPQPWQKVGSAFFDNDIMPEGIAVKYATGPFFASAFGYWLSERGTASDATLVGGQLGLARDVGAVKLTGALGYFDVGGVQGQVTTLLTGGPCIPNGAFFGGAQGNTTVSDGDGCLRLASDFNVLDALVQADVALAERPLTLFAQYVQNREAEDLDSGYALGFTYGKAANPHSWEIGYLYQTTGKDAQFGQFVDSDFAGGVTDADGSVFRVGYAPAKSWVLNGTYFVNERFLDAPGATPRDYDRYQIDLTFRF